MDCPACKENLKIGKVETASEETNTEVVFYRLISLVCSNPKCVNFSGKSIESAHVVATEKQVLCTHPKGGGSAGD